MAPDALPDRIAQYRVIALLGAGGMGEVFLAEDDTLGRRVAIKRLKSDHADQQAARRMLVEARAAARLDHPHICGIYEVGEDAAGPFIVMPVVDGHTLAARLGKGPLPIVDAVDIGAQVADALAAAHAHGILHRDIKPANVIVNARGQARVMDFGLAKFTSAAGGALSALETATELTTPGTTIGTMAYMSPEQARGEAVDARTDLFSLGVVLYEMIAGRRPFSGASAVEQLTAMQTGEPAPLARFRPETPDALQRIVTKTLQKSPAERYQSAGDLLVDLRGLLRELQGGLPTVSTAPRQGSARARLVLGTLLGAAVLVAGVFVFRSWPSSTAPSDQVLSLAVLPFANNSGADDKAFIADGMTESLIRSLSQVRTLSVLSRNTMFRFRGRNADAQAVGKQLGMAAVMTGAVSRSDDQLVIDIEISRVRDASVILSRQYLRPAADVVSIEGEIAQDVAKSLRLKLSGDESRHLAQRPTSNPEAYQNYLRGRSFANRFDPASQHQAIDYFKLAVRADPNYAEAFVAAAVVYTTLGLYFDAPKDAMEEARANARQALAIDPDSVDAHIVLGQINLNFDWDRAAALREMSTSEGLLPQAIEVYTCTAHLLETTGHAGEAERGLRRALVNDPLSVPLNTELGCGAYYRRAYDAAIRGNREALQLDPHNEVAYWGLGRAYGQKQMYGDALAELTKAVPATGGASPLILSEMGYVYAKSGRASEARAILAKLAAAGAQMFVDPYLVAAVHAGLGDETAVLDWLDKAYDVRSSFMVSLGSEPKWDAVRASPRFKALVKRVGFE